MTKEIVWYLHSHSICSDMDEDGLQVIAELVEVLGS